MDKELIEQVGRLYSQGVSKDNIKKQLKVSLPFINDSLSELGLSRETKSSTLLRQKDEIVAKYESGIGSTTLAEEYGCGCKTMITFLKKHTVVKRKTPVVDKLRENKQSIIDSYNSGDSTYKIAKLYGTQDAMIYLFLRDECGVQMRVNNEKRFEDHASQVVELYNAGLTIAAIAEKIGCSKTSVHEWCKHLNLDSSRFSSAREIPLNTHADDIVSKYNSGTGCTVLSQEYDCSETSILKLVRKCGHETGINHRKYDLQHDYFHEIDSWEKAYWLGWALTDGSNSNHSYRLVITDREICEKFNASVHNETPIKFRKRRMPHHKDQYVAEVNSVQMCKDLSNLGIIRNKTHETYFPDIDEKYWAAFLLGATEGDGSILLRKNKNGKYHCCWSLIGNYRFVKGVAERISRKLNIAFVFYDKETKNGNIKILRTRFQKDAVKLLDYIYQDAPQYLQRKYDRYKLIKGSPCSNS